MLPALSSFNFIRNTFLTKNAKSIIKIRKHLDLITIYLLYYK